MWYNYFSTRGGLQWAHSKTDENFSVGRKISWWRAFNIFLSSRCFLHTTAEIIQLAAPSGRPKGFCGFALFCLGTVLRLAFGLSKGKGGRAVGLAPALSIGGRGGGNAVGSNPSELGAQRDRTFGCKVEGDKATWGAATYNLATARADFVSQFPAIPNPDPVALCCEATSEVGYIRKLDPATSPSDVAAYISWWRSWSIRKHRSDFA